jgi:hypothetical protein
MLKKPAAGKNVQIAKKNSDWKRNLLQEIGIMPLPKF